LIEIRSKTAEKSAQRNRQTNRQTLVGFS